MNQVEEGLKEMHSFETFLTELAKTLELPGLKPDENGACLIVMKDGQIRLLFEYDELLVPNTILISSEITSIPIDYLIDVYELILIENYQIEETLSVKPDENMLYLHKRINPFIQSIDLKELLKSFVTNVKKWREDINKIAQNPPKTKKVLAPPSKIQAFPYKA